MYLPAIDTLVTGMSRSVRPDLVKVILPGGGAEVLKDHRSSSKGNLAKSQRFKEEESELFVQYFHLIRRAVFTMQNAKANSQTEVDRKIFPG